MKPKYLKYINQNKPKVKAALSSPPVVKNPLLDDVTDKRDPNHKLLNNQQLVRLVRNRDGSWYNQALDEWTNARAGTTCVVMWANTPPIPIDLHEQITRKYCGTE